MVVDVVVVVVMVVVMVVVLDVVVVMVVVVLVHSPHSKGQFRLITGTVSQNITCGQPKGNNGTDHIKVGRLRTHNMGFTTSEVGITGRAIPALQSTRDRPDMAG